MSRKNKGGWPAMRGPAPKNIYLRDSKVKHVGAILAPVAKKMMWKWIYLDKEYGNKNKSSKSGRNKKDIGR